MKKSSDEIRRKIIGLGDSSVKKSYYPLLREKIRELEEKQRKLVGVVRSLEEREAELEELLEEKTLLLAEVNHRVKNNLQIVTSLLNLAESDPDSSVSDRFSNARKRVETLSLVYQEFLFSENYSEVMICDFLRNIDRELRTELVVPDVKTDFNYPVEEIILSVDSAIPFALIVYEILTGVFHFVSLSGADTVRIVLVPNESAESKKQFHFEASSQTDSSGEPQSGCCLFSRDLIYILSDQIAGEYTLEHDDCSFRFSMDFNG